MSSDIVDELVERLQSHMGKADMGEVLRDCRLAAARIASLQAELAKARSDFEEMGSKFLQAKFEAAKAREANRKLHRRIQIAEGAAISSLGIVDSWIPHCKHHMLSGHDIMLRAIKSDLEASVAKFRHLQQTEREA